jgi:PEGA domain
MSATDDDHDDAPALPKRELLEAWQVPPPAPDFTDRIMAHVEAALPMGAVVALPTARRRGGLSLAVVGVAMVAAAALVLGLAQTWHRTPAAEPAEPAVAAPPLDAEPAVAPTPRGTPLMVYTTPRDATVRLDGRPLSGPSPFVVSALPPGPHRLEVEREGYLPEVRTLEGGAPLELPVELALREVVLIVAVDPPHAEVSLWADDTQTRLGADEARHVLRREPDVRYELEATAPGFLPRRIPLAFGGGPDEAVTLHLVPDSAAAAAADKPARSGSPDLKNPFGRRGIRESGDPLASGAPGTSPGLKDPFRSRSTDEGEGEGEADDDDKGDDAGKTAAMHIGVDKGASWATVHVDGKRLGNTPLMNVKVAPGRHTVKWVWPNGASTTVAVVLESGQTKIVKGSPPADPSAGP